MTGGRTTTNFLSSRKGWVGALTACALIITAAVADAGESKKIQQLRKNALTNPTDFAAAMDYASAAIEARDEEAAIATLERLLFYNPNMPGLRFALGNLYARLGAHAMAIGYYEEALASTSDKFDKAMRVRAQVYLERSRKQLRSTRVDGALTLGMRYDSNPAHLPGSSFTDDYASSSAGYLDLLKYRDGAEEAAYAAAQLHIEHDLSQFRRDRLEVNLAGYASHNLNYDVLDGEAFTVDAGPRFVLVPGAGNDLSIRPYLKADSAFSDWDRMISTGGGGVAMALPVGRWFTLEPYGEWRDVHANVNDESPYTSGSLLSDGTLTSGGLTAKWLPNDFAMIELSGRYDRHNAQEDFLDADIVKLSASVTFDVPPPLDTMPYSWSLTPYVRYVDAKFDEANSSFAEYFPAKTRHDEQWRSGVSANLPLTSHIGLSGLVEYQRNNSNIERFRSHGVTGAIGLTISF